MNAKPLTAIDLFAGCGGLSLGLKWAGWEVICAVERSPMAAETYFANFVSSTQDIDAEYAEHLRKASVDQMRAGLLVSDVRIFQERIGAVRDLLGGHELGLLAGGPPCQGFSFAGRRRPDDPRNALVWNFLELTDLLSPLVVLIENVDAIQTYFEVGKRASVLDGMEDALEDKASNHGGYSVVRLSLRADHYGVPQRRKRTFLIGVRKDIARSIGVPSRDLWDSECATGESSRNVVAPAVMASPAPTASEAIWDLVDSQYAPIDAAPSALARKYAVRSRGLDSSQDIVSATPNGAEPPNHRFRCHKDTTRTRFRLLRLFQEYGISKNLFVHAATGRADIESQLRPLETLLPIEFPMRTVKTRRQLENLVRSLPSFKQSQRVLDVNAPSPTITTLPDDLCHYAADRTLTVREMARLQSFPDSFVFRGKDTTGGRKRRVEVPQYSQVANAVPPMLAVVLGKQLKQLLLLQLPEVIPNSDR